MKVKLGKVPEGSKSLKGPAQINGGSKCPHRARLYISRLQRLDGLTPLITHLHLEWTNHVNIWMIAGRDWSTQGKGVTPAMPQVIKTQLVSIDPTIDFKSSLFIAFTQVGLTPTPKPRLSVVAIIWYCVTGPNYISKPDPKPAGPRLGSGWPGSLARPI